MRAEGEDETTEGVAGTLARPRLSVVVGSHNARGSVEACLAALTAPGPANGVEIVVVDNSTDGTFDVVRQRFPGVRLIPGPSFALVPELWGVGIRDSTGDVVAITSAQCVPARDWLSRIVEAHEAPVAAVGGAVEHDGSAGVVGWAVYLCRYSAYMLPFAERPVAEIAGDNASYKRAHLDGCREAWRAGFWEPAVHAALRRAGLGLKVVPSIVVHHKASGGFTGFLRQRFRHGRQFGGERAARLGRGTRALYIALSPLIPLVLLSRIVGNVLARGRHRRALLACLPILVPFLAAWACGELIGYLRGPDDA